MVKLIKITDLTKKLNLIDSKSKKPLNYIVRYWEKEFKQIKPKIINKRRYYDQRQVEIFQLINFLLKKRGMTLRGVKNVLNDNINKLDDHNSFSLKAEYYRNNIKLRSKKILEKIKTLKKNGKKNTHKSKNGTREQSGQ